jgi:putative endonuclease
VKRVHEHKSKLVEGFSKRYGLDKLVYFEPIKSQEEAFLREKRLKTWKRNWKLELIEKGNPEWKDLYSDLI